jgi:hypothetical protein
MRDSGLSDFAFLRKVNVLLVTLSVLSFGVYAGPAEQARRIHDRIAGVPPTNTVLANMTSLVAGGNVEGAARVAMNNPAFYNTTLKNFVSPWTNEAQDVFFPLNDFSATVIGMIRDDVDFREVLSGNILYVGQGTGVPGYSRSDNASYEFLEANGRDLSSSSVLVQRDQTTFTGLPDYATAGVMTTRAGAEAYFIDGTNRAMFRFTMMNFLCSDLEPLKDVTRTPDRVRRDVSRSPGGDSRVYMNSCVGCHAGMDGMTGAFAYYDFDEVSGMLQYHAVSDNFDVNGVAIKYNINANNFKYGYITTDDSWVNYWRNGHNKLLGWRGGLPDAKGHTYGNGAKALGQELANTRAFSTCQVKKTFKAVCFRDPNNYAADRAQVESIADYFEANGYKMKDVFAKVAAYCSN